MDWSPRTPRSTSHVSTFWLAGGHPPPSPRRRVLVLTEIRDQGNSTDESIWVLLELTLGIICACLPVMWPIIRRSALKMSLGSFGSSKKRYSSNAYRVDSDDPHHEKSLEPSNNSNPKIYDGGKGHSATKTVESDGNDLETVDLPPNGIYVKRDFEMT